MAISDQAIRDTVAAMNGYPTDAQVAAANTAPMAVMPAPQVTPSMTMMLPASDPGSAATPSPTISSAPAVANPNAALIGALVAPRPPQPTMGTVYGVPAKPISSNTQGLALIGQGIMNGLDGRDALQKQDAAQDALQDAQEGWNQ